VVAVSVEISNPIGSGSLVEPEATSDNIHDTFVPSPTASILGIKWESNAYNGLG